MNGTSLKLKKFLSNRNTVAIICAVIGIAVLYFGYNMRVKAAIKPVSVPYAKETIQPRTKITDDMIGYMEVASEALKTMGEGVLLDAKDIKDHYSNINTMIPKGSMFYSESVVEERKLTDFEVYQVPEGKVLVQLGVNMQTSYGKKIVPGGTIDLYVRTKHYASQKVMVGKFIENIEVLEVEDASALPVFENTEENRVPAYIYFVLPEEQYRYILAMTQLGINIHGVPTNMSQAESQLEPNIKSQDIMDYVDELSILVDQGTVVLNPEANNVNGG